MNINSIPREMLAEIFRFVRFKGKNWLHVKLVCKKWNEIADRIFDPNQVDALQLLLDYNAKEDVVLKLVEGGRITPGPKRDREFSLLIIWASERGYQTLVKRLLQDKRLNPSLNYNLAINDACRNGHIEVVKMLLEHKRVDPSASNNLAIKLASQNGHVTVVDRLLHDDRVDPSKDSNDALKFACQNGHLKVVERLLQDPRVNPTWKTRDAGQNGHFDIVRLLLKDKRTDLRVVHDELLCIASKKGELDLVKQLLKEGVVNSSSAAIKLAVFGNWFEIVDILLDDGRIDPTIDDNLLIAIACKIGNYFMVRRILRDDRINPSAQDNLAFRLAKFRRHTKVIELLMADPRFKE